EPEPVLISQVSRQGGSRERDNLDDCRPDAPGPAWRQRKRTDQRGTGHDQPPGKVRYEGLAVSLSYIICRGFQEGTRPHKIGPSRRESDPVKSVGHHTIGRRLACFGDQYALA